MKPLIVGLVLAITAWIIAVFHPFSLALPWQTGDSTSVNLSLQRIMSETDLDLVEADWGRTTPLSYVAADGLFTGTGQPAEVCQQLTDALNAWGRVVDTARNADGCSLEAAGPGPMRAHIDLVETERRQLRVEVRVQHAP